MSTTLVHVARAFTPTTEIPDAAILISDGVIEAVAPRSAVTLPSGAAEILAKDKIVAPGFLDVHIHGAGGHDVISSGLQLACGRQGLRGFIPRARLRHRSEKPHP